MSRTVFILGAGASQEAGGPLMADFLDVADKLRRRNEVGNAGPSFDLVFKGLGCLNAAHAKAILDVDNIESVFGAFEMARLCGRLGPLSEKEVQELGPSIRRLIVTTLEKSIHYPVVGGTVRPPQPYFHFGDLVAKINASDLGPVSFITLNYDVALDHMVHLSGQRIAYFSTPAYTGVPVMKLHGSLNWARCAKCSRVVPWPLSEFFQGFKWRLQNQTNVPLDLASKLTQFQHCGQACQSEPVIVPPTWNKAEYQAEYQEVVFVWQWAAQHLSEAENIVVIGYSLPETDQFFRYLYALGTIGDARLKHFIVVDPSKETAERFLNLLGPTARTRFQHRQGTFSSSIGLLHGDLGLA